MEVQRLIELSNKFPSSRVVRPMSKKGSGAYSTTLVVVVWNSLLIKRGLSRQSDHFTVTAFVAKPPRLLRTVMFCGLEDQEKSLRYRPPPSFCSVPISVLVEVTNTCSVALALELLASTRSCRLPDAYSATWMATASAAGGVGVRVGVAGGGVGGTGEVGVGGSAVGVGVATAPAG